MGKEYDARPYAGDPYYAYIMKGAYGVPCVSD